MSEVLSDAPRYPMARGRCPFDPPPELDRRLREEPVSKVRIWDGGEPWLFTRYEGVPALLADSRRRGSRFRWTRSSSSTTWSSTGRTNSP
ncbi:hypothetical protein NKH77_52470 [Streptomyces sp. M19]